MKISVITICLNNASTILDTVRSVSEQTHHNFEHLVLDGNSTDGTVKLVEDNLHPSLILKSEPDEGIYDALNKGLKLAKGDVIGFLNADDFYADNKVLTRIANTFDNQQIEACYGDLLYVTKDMKKIVRYWKSRQYTSGLFAHGWSPAHPTFYIRRSALERLGGFNEAYKIAGDIEFMMRYLERGGVRAVYVPNVQVRMRIGGISNRSWRNTIFLNQEILHALSKNKIPHTILSFFFYKFCNRIWQRVSVMLYKD